MKVKLKLALVVLSLCLCSYRGEAQLALTVTNSPNPVVISNTLNYTFTLANISTVSVTNIFLVSSNLPSAVFQNAAGTNGTGVVATFTNLAGVSSFFIQALPTGQAVQLILSLMPTNFGSITNFVTVTSLNATNLTNILTTQVISAQSDLGVTVTSPPVGALTNDWITFNVSAFNAGSNSVSNVILTNALSAGVGVISVSPSQAFTYTNGNLAFSLGTLTAGASRNLSVTVQPTNAGTLTWIANVDALGLLDTNLTNNTVTNSYSVGTNLTGNLIATNFSAMDFNPQTALMTQTVALVNIDVVSVASARVIVAGLPLTNRLFNAVGTNDGKPFVVFGGTLVPGAATNLVLEYFVRSRTAFPVANSDYTAMGVPLPNNTVPGGTPTPINTMAILPSGDVVLQFSAVANSTYTIVYSDNDVMFTNPIVAQPRIHASSTTVQWLDDGPPKTVSHPPNPGARYYRLYLNP